MIWLQCGTWTGALHMVAERNHSPARRRKVAALTEIPAPYTGLRSKSEVLGYLANAWQLNRRLLVTLHNTIH
jgi:hypothetical protein